MTKIVCAHCLLNHKTEKGTFMTLMFKNYGYKKRHITTKYFCLDLLWEYLLVRRNESFLYV